MIIFILHNVIILNKYALNLKKVSLTLWSCS